MSVEVKKEIELEIAYVLFIDIVGYSKLVTHEQRRLLELLTKLSARRNTFALRRQRVASLRCRPEMVWRWSSTTLPKRRWNVP